MNQAEPKLIVTASRQLTSWMAQHRVSLVFSTYRTGKLFLIGLQSNGRLSIFERTFNRTMGLCAVGQQIYLSTLFQIWRFDNALQHGQAYEGHDRVYVPQVAWTTGDIDAHDMAVDGGGRLVFVNTLFSCLATLSESHSFVPLWRPPFITKLAAEDRCHLNGVALRDGKPAYVTAVSQSDTPDAWREQRVDGGVVMDVPGGTAITTGLSMPHSPRLHEGRLWLLDSGRGNLGSVDTKKGTFTPLAFCPGYTRGLAFVENHAVVGLSKPRERTFTGLDLDDNLAAKGAEPRCGLLVIDLESGDTLHWMRIEGLVSELYDVAVLPGVRRPMALGLRSNQIRHTVTVGETVPLAKKKPARRKKKTGASVSPKG